MHRRNRSTGAAPAGRPRRASLVLSLLVALAGCGGGADGGGGRGGGDVTTGPDDVAAPVDTPALPDAARGPDAGPMVADTAPVDVAPADAAGEVGADLAPDAGCDPATAPTPVVTVAEGWEVVPGTTVHLFGDRSVAASGSIRRWSWTASAPDGSTATFVPSSTFPNPGFEMSVAGSYTFCLEVWDDRGQRSCAPMCTEVVAVSDEAVRVELVWRNPDDPDETDGPSSDVTLHVLHPSAPSDPAAPDHDGDGAPDPYYDPVYDCWRGNPAPDWGVAGDPRDDPACGGEGVILKRPEANRSYEVAVHYRDDAGLGPAVTTVRVYIHQELVFHLENVRLEEGDLWSVAFVDWPTGAVRLAQGPGGGYRTTHAYPVPAR